MKILHKLLSIPALAALLVAALPARAATEPGKPQALTSPFRLLLTLSALLFSVAAHAAPFVGGGVVVSVVGDGTTLITTGTVVVPITLTEYTTAGSLTGGGVTLPVVDAGANYATTASMTSTSCGFLRRSLDGNYLTMTGANVPAGTQVSAFSSSEYPNRTIARIDTAGNVDTSTRFNAAGTTPRSAITTNGTDFWWSGDTGTGNTGGIRYMALGATTSGSALAQGSAASATTAGQPAPVPYNMRVLNIFNGQLYGTSNIGVGASGSNQVSFRGVFNVGTGLPTTANQFGSLIVGSDVGNAGLQDSPYDFFFADASTIYVGDDDTTATTWRSPTAPPTGGITKWRNNGSSWSKTWLALPAGSTGVRALAGVTDDLGNVVIYGVTAVASGQNQLVKLVDTLSGSIAPSFETLATAPTNYLFRGVALSPAAVPEPSTYAAWQSANGTAQAANLDHDSDGIFNGVEHFLGGIANTTGNSNPLPGVTNTAGVLSVTWTRHPDFPGFPANYGTAVIVETSATLTDPWTPAVVGVGAGFVEITGNNVKYTFPAGTKDFARLKVVQTP